MNLVELITKYQTDATPEQMVMVKRLSASLWLCTLRKKTS